MLKYNKVSVRHCETAYSNVANDTFIMELSVFWTPQDNPLSFQYESIFSLHLRFAHAHLLLCLLSLPVLLQKKPALSTLFSFLPRKPSWQVTITPEHSSFLTHSLAPPSLVKPSCPQFSPPHVLSFHHPVRTSVRPTENTAPTLHQSFCNSYSHSLKNWFFQQAPPKITIFQPEEAFHFLSASKRSPYSTTAPKSSTLLLCNQTVIAQKTSLAQKWLRFSHYFCAVKLWQKHQECF